MNARIGAMFLVSVLSAGPAAAQGPDPLSSARNEFARAYTAADYAALCEILHPEASFRGSLKPERWSHTRDQILGQRWNASSDCTCAKVELCKPFGPQGGLQTTSIGQSEMLITPDLSRQSSQFGKYFIDTGRFTMADKARIKQNIENPYMILWYDVQTDSKKPPNWKIKQIDMHPCSDQPEPC